MEDRKTSMEDRKTSMEDMEEKKKGGCFEI